MNDDSRANGDKYRPSSRLLARKGSAEPLPVRGDRLVPARDDDIEPSAGDRLADAVTDATLEALAPDPPHRRMRRSAARLTDLFDPALADIAHRGSADPSKG